MAFGLVAVASVGFPGLAAFDARTELVEQALSGPLAVIVFIGTLAPIAYYGRLLAIGVSRPDRVLEPVNAWRPAVPPVDVRAPRTWLRTTGAANRAFTTASIAALLAVLAMATSAGAFGGPAAAAEARPELAIPIQSGGQPAPPAASGTPAVPGASGGS